MQFEDSVRKHFSYLKENFLCEEIFAEKYDIRYQLGEVRIQICYDFSRSFELSCSISREGDGGDYEVYGLEEVMGFQNVEHQGIPLQVSDLGAIDNAIYKLSKLFLAYGVAVFQAEEKFFVKLAEYRNRKSDEYALRRNLIKLRQELDHAWQNHNYSLVVELLQPFENEISNTERCKLEYAKKQLN